VALPRQKLSRRKVTLLILRHSHAAKCAGGSRAGADDPEAGGAQEAVLDVDLCYGGACVGIAA
jgi:hypothetical protein